MKRKLACTAIALAFAVPMVSQAHDHDRGGYYRGGPGYYHHDGLHVIGDVIALPFVAAGVVLGAAATLVAAPFAAAAGAYQAPAPAYYPPPQPAYYSAPAPTYYAPPPAAYYPQPAPVYYQPAPAYVQPRVVYYH